MLASRRRWFSLCSRRRFARIVQSHTNISQIAMVASVVSTLFHEIQHETYSSERAVPITMNTPSDFIGTAAKSSKLILRLSEFVVPKTSTDAAFLSPNSEQRESLWG